MEARLAEAHKMGFAHCVAPAGNLKRITAPAEIELRGVENVSQAMEALF